MNKQLLALFVSNFAILFIGFGVFPLLPVNAARYGAAPSAIGLYLALIYVAISLGSLLPGWLSGRIGRKLVFVAAGALGALALVLLGFAAQFWQVVVLTGITWFTGGVGLALANVFAGLSAEEGQRGRWFGILALTTPLGAVIGGAATAWLVAAYGYRVLFAAVGLVFALWPLSGLLLLEDRSVPQSARARTRDVSPIPLGGRFALLAASVLLAGLTINVDRLGLSLSMKAAAFSPSEIAEATVAGGLVTIPLVLGSGLLSDRLGRRVFLAAGFLLAVLGSAVLAGASQLWQFWVVSAAVLAARSISASQAAALAADTLAPETLGRGLPLLNSVNWISAVLGFAGSGAAAEAFGAQALYWAAALFSLAAVGLLGLAFGRPRAVALRPVTARPGETPC